MSVYNVVLDAPSIPPRRARLIICPGVKLREFIESKKIIWGVQLNNGEFSDVDTPPANGFSKMHWGMECLALDCTEIAFVGEAVKFVEPAQFKISLSREVENFLEGIDTELLSAIRIHNDCADL